MSAAARLILAGILLTGLAVAAYASVGWEDFFERYPHYLRPSRVVVGSLLPVLWYWAFAVGGLVVVFGFWRMFTSRARLTVLWKLFAYVTLWAIGSVSFFVGLFLAYVPTLPEGGTELLVPALLGGLGYFLLGLGFVVSILRQE